MMTNHFVITSTSLRPLIFIKTASITVGCLLIMQENDYSNIFLCYIMITFPSSGTAGIVHRVHELPKLYTEGHKYKPVLPKSLPERNSVSA